MPIIYPPNCRGVTAGALKQIKKDGYTTASKGLFSSKFVTIKGAISLNDYFSKIEPAGEFMAGLETAKQQIEETSEAIIDAARKLVANAQEANKEMAGISGKFRSGTEHLGVAINKMMQVVSRGDYEKTVKLTCELVDALERLAVLEEKGLLDKVMKAMSK